MEREQTRSEAFEGWAIVELMGHRRIGGMVSEVTQFGSPMMRIDVFVTGAEAASSTHFYGARAVYAVHPTTEEIARRIADGAQPQPVRRWELPPAGGEQAAEVAEYSPLDQDDELSF